MLKIGKFEFCPLGRGVEFFEDSKGKFATPSLIAIAGVSFLSVVIILDALHGKTSEAVIGVYATLIGSLYGLKKGFDSSEIKAQIKADTAPSTVNVENIEKTDKITESGDVNVNTKKRRK